MDEDLVDPGHQLIPAAQLPAETTTDYYVLASDLNGGNPLASIPKWVWFAAAAGAVYWYWKKHKNNERDLIEESEEE
jgi:hypothetical protein